MRNTNDPTTLSILLQDFDKHLSKRGYRITGIIGADQIQILNKTNSQSKLLNQLVMVTKYNLRIKGLEKNSS